MPHLQEVLNELKWTKDLHKVTISYVHRGALHNTKVITGSEITRIGKSFLETATASIPYHRITKILYDDKMIFDRSKIHSKDKQL